MRTPFIARLSLMGIGVVIGMMFVVGLMTGPARAQTSCIRMVFDQRGKTLLNLCPACRTVKVEHNRLGTGTPIFRDYTMGPESRLRLPFRGPGRTRVIGEGACPRPGDGAAADDGGDKKICVRLARARNGRTALVNGCDACRSVIAERVYSSGSRTQQTYAIAGGSSVPLDQEGAAQVRVLEDRACR